MPELNTANSETDSDQTVTATTFGEGDTHLMLDVLPAELAQSAFEDVRAEVQWNVMYHRGGEVPRLVAVQGEIGEDGSIPIYRHPSDAAPPLRAFTPTLARIKPHVEAALGHAVNHVLIQHYRRGADCISEHADKTIDVVRGSRIANVSLGAQRVMVLRTKKDKDKDKGEGEDEGVEGGAGVRADVGDSAGAGVAAQRKIQRIPLPHNSMLAMGLATNAKWTHAIRADKRPASLKHPLELANAGARISLTFRHIGTFLLPADHPDPDPDPNPNHPDSNHHPDSDRTHAHRAHAHCTRIYGQGAKAKTKAYARPVVNGTHEAEELLVAFGRENHESEFDWDAVYGAGSDVLHFSTPSNESPPPPLDHTLKTV